MRVDFMVHMCIQSCLPLWLRWQRICLQCRRPRSNRWLGKNLWRRALQSTPVFFPTPTKEPGGLESMDLQRVKHDWATPLSLSFSLGHCVISSTLSINWSLPFIIFFYFYGSHLPFPFFFFLFFYLWWILSYIEMKQPRVYMCSPSQSPLPNGPKN